MIKKCIAEMMGTFWLVLGGCGSAILAANFLSGPDNSINMGIAFPGVALAFGLTVMTMAYAIGHISGCHLNPAVSIGLWMGGRFPGTHIIPYVFSQLIGGFFGACVIYAIASGAPDYAAGGFASNGYGELSPGGYSLRAVFVCEVVMTFMFLIIILGSTDKRAPSGFAPIAIGLGLTLIHLISIPVSNTSVNPARSLATAAYADGEYLSQVWLFWVAPILGALLAGLTYKWLGKEK